MWRYAFLNLCFVLLLITLLSIQHSAAVFGPGRDQWERYVFTVDGESARSSRMPAAFRRAAAFLNDTWRRGKFFNEWLMEYNASQWEFLRASSPVETDLLDVKFHIANAEVFTEAMRETDRAIKELDRAAISLHDVQTLVKPDLARQLTNISAEITAAEMNEQKGNAIPGAPFETIKADLDHLIRAVRVS